MNLKDYIGRVFYLEKSCYEQELLIEQLNVALNAALNPRLLSLEGVPSPVSGWDKLLFVLRWLFTFCLVIVVGGILGGACSFVLVFILTIILPVISLFFLITGNIFPPLFFLTDLADSCSNFYEALGNVPTRSVVLIGSIICIVAAVAIFLAIFQDERGNVNNDKNRREKALQNNKYAKEENERIKVRAQMQAENLSAQISRAKLLYKQTKDMKDKFYEVGIIYKKYRGFVPVSMMYEYLCSGRCSRLEGYEGAYNLYEKELKMNIIIGKLDIIITKLDKIRDTQYELFNALQEGNQISQQIYNEIINCTDQMRRTEANTRISTYYNQISATSTEYMAWLRKYGY